MNINLLEISKSFIYLLPILYAETHYKFRGIYSRLRKKEPEIIADVPHRLEPGHPLPVLLFIKDAHRFPLALESVTVTRLSGNHQHEMAKVDFHELRIELPSWHQVLNLPLAADISGPVKIDVAISIRIGEKRLVYHNDNYRLSSHLPFPVLVDPYPLPKGKDWYWGDLHYHSDLTSDQVEFGAPLEASVALARACGLNFVGVTDHSYDLDDSPDDFLRNHPDLPKWRLLWQQAELLNASSDSFVLLPGEELSAGNCQNRNVHLLLLNNRRFFPGSGDSAEKWFRTNPEYRLDQVLPVLEREALAFAAHPAMNPPLLQRLLIRRGYWQSLDYRLPRLDGMQIWNGEKNQAFEEGIEEWVRLLLEGQRLSIIAGNDAHGNFGRFRQIGIPFFSFRENHQELFAKTKTGVYLESGLSFEGLVQALRRGRSIISDGPFAEMRLIDSIGKKWRIGDECPAENGLLITDIRSSPTFGEIISASLFLGAVEQKKEKLIRSFSPGGYIAEAQFPVSELPSWGYLRLDVTSKAGEQIYRCLTNPIYLRRE
jgi:hypothetical protein